MAQEESFNGPGLNGRTQINSPTWFSDASYRVYGKYWHNHNRVPGMCSVRLDAIHKRKELLLKAI